MQNHEIEIRLASLKDGKEIFDWRNDKNSRAMFFNGGRVSLDLHNN